MSIAHPFPKWNKSKEGKESQRGIPAVFNGAKMTWVLHNRYRRVPLLWPGDPLLPYKPLLTADSIIKLQQSQHPSVMALALW